MSLSKRLWQLPLSLALIFAFAAGEDLNLSENARKIKSRVIPAYPELARAMNVKGVVRLEALVTPAGDVKSIRVVGGHPVLVEAAQRAVYKWRWERVGHESSESIELRFTPD